MNWIYLVILAQFIGAMVFMIDKYLVSPRALNRPVVYAFYVGILSSVVLLVLPFGGVSVPNSRLIILSLAVALTYIFSLILMYHALQVADASDAAPVVGAVTAISTLIFSGFLLKSDLPQNFFIGFPLLIIGTFLMSALRFDHRATTFVLVAGVFFGLSSVFTKMMFSETTFINGFFWSRMANVIGALFLLLWPANFKAIMTNIVSSPPATKLLVILNKVLAGVAALLILIAISLGDVSVVNSLAGFQFIFILIFAFILTYKLPKYYHEAVHREGNRLKKITASALIIAGFVLMFY